MSDLVPAVFHEKQEGQLCAQHAVNNLLQGSYFTAVDLAELARELDAEERLACSEKEKGVAEGESSNYDESGFFSVQGFQG
jgi:Ataxin-3